MTINKLKHQLERVTAAMLDNYQSRVKLEIGLMYGSEDKVTANNLLSALLEQWNELKSQQLKLYTLIKENKNGSRN